MSAPKWTRKMPGKYESKDGWKIEQAQGDRFPRWYVWEPRRCVVMDEPIAWGETLREAKVHAAQARGEEVDRG